MQDVSAVGLSIRLLASVTYPIGTDITAFPEEGENGPDDNHQIVDNTTGVNGELITWDVINGIPYTLLVIPNTPDDDKLDFLFEANRASKNKRSKKDVITLVVTNPVTGVTKTYLNGKVKTGIPGYRYGNDGRIRNKTYGFVFEDVV